MLFHSYDFKIRRRSPNLLQNECVSFSPDLQSVSEANKSFDESIESTIEKVLEMQIPKNGNIAISYFQIVNQPWTAGYKRVCVKGDHGNNKNGDEKM